MIMRFYPGLAIGHTYRDFESAAQRSSATEDSHDWGDPSRAPGDEDSRTEIPKDSTAGEDSDGTMNSMDGGWEGEAGSQHSGQEVWNGGEEDLDDEQLIALHDMYD